MSLFIPAPGGGGGITGTSEITSTHPALGMPLLFDSNVPEHTQSNGSNGRRIRALNFQLNEVANMVPMKVPTDLDLAGTITLTALFEMSSDFANEVQLQCDFWPLTNGTGWDNLGGQSRTFSGDFVCSSTPDAIQVLTWQRSPAAATAFTPGGYYHGELKRIPVDDGSEHPGDLKLISLFITWPRLIS